MDTFQKDGAEKIPDYVKDFQENRPLFFKNLSDQQVKDLIRLSTYREFEKNEIILQEGEEVDTAYLVVEGKISIWKDSIQLITISEGNLIGETFIFPDNYRIASVIAENDCSLLRFERKQILDYLKEHPRKLTKLLTRNLILIQEKKLAHMNKQLTILKNRLVKNNNPK